jgi:dipeptidyl aminopeptidase/acylaminoacyl peptidase
MGRGRYALAAVCAALGFAAAPAHAAFPGANGKIAFNSAFNGLSTVNPDGTGEAPLDLGAPVPYASPGATASSWSPDGSKLLVERPTYFNEPGEPTGTHMFVVPAEGGSATVVGSGLRGEGAAEGSWSRDGTKIVSAGLLVMNADGTGRTNIGFEGELPQWSPTEDRIVFSRRESAGGIWTVNADGSGLMQVTANPSDSWPDWSPDGKQIVLLGPNGVEVVNPDGTGRRRLTSDGFIDMSPKFSPDGTQIVWSRYSLPITGPPELWVMNADGSDQRSLGVISDETRTGPAWQPLPILNHPPACNGVSASRHELWPPNRRLLPVSLAGATDSDGDQVTLDVTTVAQDEPVRGGYDARLRDDSVLLRAERDVRGDGRVYRVAFTVSDGELSCDGTVTVNVRRHRHAPAVDSSPPAYRSTP